jgi:hypothetical protein
MSNRRRGRTKLLSHVMHLVVGCRRHHLRHRGGEVDGEQMLLPACWGGMTLLVRDMGRAAREKGRIVLWRPMADPFNMLVLVTCGLCTGPELVDVLLVCPLLKLPP